MQPVPGSKGGPDMCPRPIGKTAAQKYDLTWLYSARQALAEGGSPPQAHPVLAQREY